MAPPHSLASSRVGALRPADAARPVSLLEPLLFGMLCYVLGVVTGARLIPWLVDRGLFPVRRHDPREP